MERERYATLIELPDELRSARIVVRPYRAGDAEAVFAAIVESRAELLPWMDWVDHHQSVEDTRDFCVRCAAGWLGRTALDVGIFDARDGGFLGATGFPKFDWGLRKFEVGYWLRTSAWGHGYVHEAVRLLARLVFEELGGVRLELRCDARNERSRRVAERAGFMLEGRLRNESRDPQGRLRDTLVFGLVPEDWARGESRES
ncbi:MAG: GNAT family N-acetyltransferase [Thermomicrobiales bacterium]